MTAEEMLRLPRGHFRAELVNGELELMPLSGHPHGRIVVRLSVPLAQFIWDHGLGEVYGAETGFQLTSNPDTVLGPDVSFVSNKRLNEAIKTEGYFNGSPDLAVELLSPGDRAGRVRKKTLQWLNCGARQVWIVDPKDGTVSVHRSEQDVTRFSGADHLEAGDLLPGFRLSLDRIFGPTPTSSS